MTQAPEMLHAEVANRDWCTSTRDSLAVLHRADFLTRLEMAAHVATATPEQALLLLDINDFQSVNDAFGTDVGDSVLQVIAHRLLVRTGPGTVVGTLGGDRFGVLAEVCSGSSAVGLGQELLALVASPIRVHSYDVAMTGRVGISLLVGGPNAASSVLRHATKALRDAKAASAVRAVVCAPASGSSDARAVIRREIGHTIDTERLRLVYQPIVALSQRTIVGYEALLRWRTPDGTEVATEEFVAVAESLGFIEQIGRWALDQAIGQLSRFDATAATPPIMAVNLSARQFADPRLVDIVASSLARYDVAPSRLALEITESLAVNDPNARETIRDLRNFGCHVGLDDFGTGQSCLSYLRSLPIDFIKIDQSFVAEVTTDERAARLIDTIIRMAHDLGHCTVAEGIEDDAQYEGLRAALCSFGQGHLFGYPTAPEVLTPGDSLRHGSTTQIFRPLQEGEAHGLIVPEP